MPVPLLFGALSSVELLLLTEDVLVAVVSCLPWDRKNPTASTTATITIAQKAMNLMGS